MKRLLAAILVLVCNVTVIFAQSSTLPSRLAFGSRQDDQYAIKYVDLDGTVHVVKTNGYASSPQWTQTGVIVFEVVLDGHSEIWAHDTNTGETRQITHSKLGAAKPHVMDDNSIWYIEDQYGQPKLKATDELGLTNRSIMSFPQGNYFTFSKNGTMVFQNGFSQSPLALVKEHLYKSDFNNVGANAVPIIAPTGDIMAVVRWVEGKGEEIGFCFLTYQAPSVWYPNIGIPGARALSWSVDGSLMILGASTDTTTTLYWLNVDQGNTVPILTWNGQIPEAVMSDDNNAIAFVTRADKTEDGTLTVYDPNNETYIFLGIGERPSWEPQPVIIPLSIDTIPL